MSIGFAVAMMMLCYIIGLKKLGMLFGIIIWIGLTIAQPWLLLVWGGLFLLAASSRN